jgi:cysteine desulfurase
MVASKKRAGTEALHQIAGMAKASYPYDNLEQDREHISSLRSYLIAQLDQEFAGYEINGTKRILYDTKFATSFSEDKTAMILFHLDMKGCSFSWKRLSKRH